MNNTSAANTSLENTPNSSMIVFSEEEGIAWCSALILTCLFVFAGNLLTILLFAVHQNLRKKGLFLVINMAFADLMLGAVSLPLYIYFLGVDNQIWAGSISLTLAHIFHIVDNVSMIATINSAASISLERFYAVHWPFKYRTVSIRAYRIAIFMVWTLAVLATAVYIGLSFLTSYKHGFYVWIAFTFIPTIIICSCNIGILTSFHKGHDASQQHNRASQNKRLTKTLLFVSVFALLAWLPVIILNFLTTLDVQIPVMYLHIASILNYSSSFVNPIAYALRIPEFRQALTLCCFRRKAAINIEHTERRHNSTAVKTPVTQLRTFRADPSHINLAFEHEVVEFDTKL